MSGGKIFTFYSYKGGTGRSMVLANVAWILASNAKRVLVIDWDLEAPGIHRYFSPFLPDASLEDTDGLIEFLNRYRRAAASPSISEDDSWSAQYEDISLYAVPLDWKFPTGKDTRILREAAHDLGTLSAAGTEQSHVGPKPTKDDAKDATRANVRGTIDFVGAGRQDDKYASLVNSFGWDSFYTQLNGGAFLDGAFEQMRRDYDYVLIDSRTGISETAGVCTVQAPDNLVILFTLNVQSVEGASAVAEDVWSKRKKATDRPFRIVPVATRIDLTENRLAQNVQDYAQQCFRNFPVGMEKDRRRNLWFKVRVPYKPFYAFEEVLSVFGDNKEDDAHPLAAMIKLAEHLTQEPLSHFQMPSRTQARKWEKQYRQHPTSVADDSEKVELDQPKDPQYEVIEPLPGPTPVLRRILTFWEQKLIRWAALPFIVALVLFTMVYYTARSDSQRKQSKVEFSHEDAHEDLIRKHRRELKKRNAQRQKLARAKIKLALEVLQSAFEYLSPSFEKEPLRLRLKSLKKATDAASVALKPVPQVEAQNFLAKLTNLKGRFGSLMGAEPLRSGILAIFAT